MIKVPLLWSKAAWLAVAVLGWSDVAGATDTTITLTPQTYGYFKPYGSDQFGLSPFHAGEGNVSNFAEVGSLYVGNPAIDGNYAATIEFLIPTIPDDATITTLSLGITPQFGSVTDVQLRSYVVPTTGLDPSRIFAGGNLTNDLNLNPSKVTVDLLGDQTVNYVYDNPGQYLGFSFRETNPPSQIHCQIVFCQRKVIGSVVGSDFYTLPVLTVSYDIPSPPPPLGVPEPASWALMFSGFAIMGAALRRQRTNVTYA